MTSVALWKIYCETEGAYINTLMPTGVIPHHCHNNTNHSVSGTPILLEIIEENQVTLKEEIVPTQGYFRLEGDSIECLPNVLTKHSHTNNYDISFYAFYLVAGDENYKDVINVMINIGPISVLTVELASGSTVFQVDPLVAATLPVGFEIHINNVFIGEILSVDATTGDVTLDTSTTEIYPIGAVVELKNRMVKNFVIGAAKQYSFGLSRIGGSFFKSTYILELEYLNKSLTDTKTLIFYGEYSF